VVGSRPTAVRAAAISPAAGIATAPLALLTESCAQTWRRRDGSAVRTVVPPSLR